MEAALMPEFKKILIANRGEIAIRVMRAANELGKRTVAVYAEEDKLGLHRFKADEAYKIGEGLGPVAAYLSIEEIIRVARDVRRRRDPPRLRAAVREPRFRRCLRRGRHRLHRPEGRDHARARRQGQRPRVAIEAGVPVIPATEVLGDDMKAIAKEAAEIGYPLMLKASWGGGGRGMRPINGPEELEDKVREGRREAEAAFGNGEGYLEKMILRARHVEVQILGDQHGQHLPPVRARLLGPAAQPEGRRTRPAPYLSAAQREEICPLGKKICEHVNYSARARSSS
jgi:pyruvate carboxylase